MTHHPITWFVWSLSVFILRDVCPIYIYGLIPPFLVHQVMSPRRDCAPVQTVKEGRRPSLAPRKTATSWASPQ